MLRALLTRRRDLTTSSKQLLHDFPPVPNNALHIPLYLQPVGHQAEHAERQQVLYLVADARARPVGGEAVPWCHSL